MLLGHKQMSLKTLPIEICPLQEATKKRARQQMHVLQHTLNVTAITNFSSVLFQNNFSNKLQNLEKILLKFFHNGKTKKFQ